MKKEKGSLPPMVTVKDIIDALNTIEFFVKNKGTIPDYTDRMVRIETILMAIGESLRVLADQIRRNQ